MAIPNLKGNKKKKAGLISASDIMKGYTSLEGTVDIWSLQPLQSIPLEEKDEDWIKWNANWHETIALRELPKKAKRLQRNYNLGLGVINRSDYIIAPDNDFSEHLGIVGVKENDQTLMGQFFSIIPNIIFVFAGEMMKRDRSIIIDAVDDQDSISEMMEYKEGLVKNILLSKAMSDKQQTLMEMGINDSNPQYKSEMQAVQQLIDAETQFKSYRTVAERWAQHFVELFGRRHHFDEIELYAFIDSLIADESIVALNLRENDFTVERLQPMKTYVNISQGNKYYSRANFIVHVDFMSLPDIINTFRNDLTADQVQALEKQYWNTVGTNILFKEQNGDSQSYYDTRQSYDYNRSISAGMKEEMSAAALRNYLVGALKGDLGNYHNQFNDIKQHRVTRVWWPSMRRVGLLTKIDPNSPQPIVSQIDENFLVTEEPEYDQSLLKEQSAKTLIRGEHIDWTYITEWRYVVKIGQNIPVWTSRPDAQYENIYLYGQPIRFQFKNNGNIYDACPPIEGCRFTPSEVRSVSLVDRIKPWQIIYNILNNKAVQLMPHDMSRKLIIGRSMVKRNSLSQEDGIEPVIEFVDSMRQNPVVDIDDSLDTARETNGKYTQPFVAELSLIQDIALYFQTAQFVKGEAFASVGMSAQRMSEIGKSESATGIQQAVDNSVNQTELYFEQFTGHFLPRVWNIIIEAGQYYTVMSPTFSSSYLTSNLSRSFFSVNKLDLLMKDLFVLPRNTADIRKVMSDLKTLAIQDNTMGATFLDKVHTYMAKSPNEIIEKLEAAQGRLEQQEQSKFQQEQQMQQQQQAFMDQQKQKEMQFQDAELQKKLDSQERIAGAKNLAAVSNASPDNTHFDNSMQAAQLQQQQSNIDSQNNIKQQQVAADQQSNSDKMDLEREKLQVQREKMRNDASIAAQNKSNADIKFVQMERRKAQNKTKK